MEHYTMKMQANDSAAMSKVLAHVAAMKKLAQNFELQAADQLPEGEQLQHLEAALGAASELQRAAFALTADVQLDQPHIAALVSSAFERTYRLFMPLFATHNREAFGRNDPHL